MKAVEKLEEIFYVLSEYLGDTDPYISEDWEDEDIKSEEPIFWVTKEIRSLIDAKSLQPEITEDEIHKELDKYEQVVTEFLIGMDVDAGEANEARRLFIKTIVEKLTPKTK